MRTKTRVLTIIVPPSGPINSYYGLDDLLLEDVELIISTLQSHVKHEKDIRKDSSR